MSLYGANLVTFHGVTWSSFLLGVVSNITNSITIIAQIVRYWPWTVALSIIFIFNSPSSFLELISNSGHHIEVNERFLEH
jgi:hypothetical protein